MSEKERQMECSLNPTLRHLLALCRMDRAWVRGEGMWLFDKDGRRFLDCYAQYGAVALGHNASCVRDAVRAAMDACEPAMVQPYRAVYAEELASALTRLAPGSLSHCFLTTTGAEAVEAAIKLVRARTRSGVILSATGSFHGKTLGALALTGQSHHREGFEPLPPGFEQVEFGNAEALAARFDRGGASIGALFLEPIQGERGVHLPPPGYLARAREITARHGAALVLDEIQTGLGRTGRLFACEHDGVKPDILLAGKALGGGLFPLSACLSSADFWDEGFALRHSSTFANNNVACRVGLAVLDQLTQGGLCEEAARRGNRLGARLEQLAQRFPRIVSAVRNKGLMGAIELRPLGDESNFLSFITHRGLYSYVVASAIAEISSVLVLPTLGSEDVLRMAPPLIISDPELELAMDGIERVFELLNANPVQTIIRALGVLDQPARANETAMRVRVRRGASPDGTATRGRAYEQSLATGRMSLSHFSVSAPDYAFIVHYTSLEDVVATDPHLRGMTADQLKHFCSFTGVLGPGVLCQAPTIQSKTGDAASGLILALPLLPEEMARRGRRFVVEQIRRLVDFAGAAGARIVGLGGYTTPYTRRGLEVVGRGPAITTGNPLTAGMAFLATCRELDARGRNIGETSAAVVGAGGSVGALCARQIAREHPRRLVLIGNPAGNMASLIRLAHEIELDTGTDVQIAKDLEALDACEVIMTATAAGHPILDAVALAPGTIICDIARPSDTSARLRARPDLVVIDGGQIALPDPAARFGVGNLQGLPDGVTLACLAETILLALDKERRDCGVGNAVPLAAVDRMLALAAHHGFHLPERAGRVHPSAWMNDSALEAGLN